MVSGATHNAIACYKFIYKEKKTATWEVNAEIKKQDGRPHTELILLSTETSGRLLQTW
jgi:hypothetical protein